MTQVNTLTVARAYFNYLNSTNRTLADCYTHNSVAKDNAYNYCVQTMLNHDGNDLRIIGYNSNKFSVGFVGWHKGKMAFFYITADYDRVMLLDDIQAKIPKI